MYVRFNLINDCLILDFGLQHIVGLVEVEHFG